MAGDPEFPPRSPEAGAPRPASRAAAYAAAVAAQEADLELLRSRVLPVLDDLDIPLSAPPR